jgi:hypothetical protein
LLGLAVLYLKRLNTVKAVDCYLDVLEKNPKNKTAKKALSIIRKYSANESLSDWMTPDRIAKLFPPIPVPFFRKKNIIITFVSVMVILTVTFTVLRLMNVISNPFNSGEGRPIDQFTLQRDERNNPIQTGGIYRYILTTNQAIQIYERALSLFTAYRDEAAKINLNRILESNASEGLKNRARLLLDNMEVPGFDNFNRNDNISHSNVIQEPFLYRDVHVIWRGMATNVEITNEGTRFDLLVGYDTRTTLEGIVPVFFDKPIAINTERPLEVLGKIILAASYSEIRLEGVAIHQSGRLE